MNYKKLVMAIINKDQKSFEVLYHQYFQLVFYIVFDMIRNRDDAMELAQDVFLTVYNKISTYHGGSLKYWIVQIAKNHAKNYLERVKSKTDKVILNNDLVYQTQDDVHTSISSIDETLSKHFSDEVKRILILKIVFDMTYEEIAEDMNLSPSYVYRHYKASLGVLKLVREVFE